MSRVGRRAGIGLTACRMIEAHKLPYLEGVVRELPGEMRRHLGKTTVRMLSPRVRVWRGVCVCVSLLTGGAVCAGGADGAPHDGTACPAIPG